MFCIKVESNVGGCVNEYVVLVGSAHNTHILFIAYEMC